MFSNKFSIIRLTLLQFIIHNHHVFSLSPPPRDIDWPGWHCRNYRRGEQDGKCIKVIHGNDSSTTFADAADICAKERRDGDLLTPTILSIDSEDEQGFVEHRVMWGAGLFGGGNFGAWLAPSSYLTAQLANKSEIKMTTSMEAGVECALLQIDVSHEGPPGQPSGYGLNAKNVSLISTPCNQPSRVVCQTRKWTQIGLLDTLAKQKQDLKMITTKFEDALKELTKLRETHCGVDPKIRVACGWPGIEKWQCLQQGCCFDNTGNGVQDCFEKVTDASKFIVASGNGTGIARDS